MNAVDLLAPNVSNTFVRLKPRSEWPNLEKPKSALVERMEEALLYRLFGRKGQAD